MKITTLFWTILLFYNINGAFSESKGPRFHPKSYVIPNDQKFMIMDAKDAFDGLTDKEQFYAHYLSRASFYGGLIVLLQTSPEAPNIFRLLHRLNVAQSMESLQESVVGKNGVTDEDFQSFLSYGSGVYSNLGNYKGYGDTKIVPDLELKHFEAIVHGSEAFKNDPITLHNLWNSVKGPMFNLEDKYKQLGLGDKGVTTYFTPNCNQEDAELVNRYMKSRNIESWNNRVLKKATGFKNGKITYLYEIRNAAVYNSINSEPEMFENSEFVVTSGDYNQLLFKVNENLRNALNFTANQEETDMIKDYIESFKTGDVNAHKNGSRHWVKNKGPVIETYIGFIEVYRDPQRERSEFEGFVAMVNKKQSEKFGELVNNAEKLLPLLPWSKEFEKDVFKRPDFTSLDVMTFAGSGIPAGINIPNYDEIRQKEGFKNVNLGNRVRAGYKVSNDTKVPFLSKEDVEYMKKFGLRSFEIKVGLHELLGHGSGKLLREEPDGTLNFEKGLINPLDGKPITNVYKEGDTWSNKFPKMSSAMEECRADSVAMYLGNNDDVLNIFGVSEEEKEDMVYTLWFSNVYRGLTSIFNYSPEGKKWNQAHSWARFVILNVLKEAGEGFLTLEETVDKDGNPDLLMTLDRTKISSVGMPAMGKFLEKLQVYKSIGDYESGKKMFDSYSQFDETWIRWRDIIIAKQKPKRAVVQANSFIEDDKAMLKEYPTTVNGMFDSWRERWSQEEAREIDVILDILVERNSEHFKTS